MKFEPLNTMTVETVELINQLGQILENRLKHDTTLTRYNYLAIDSDGEIWVSTHQPYTPYHGVWDCNREGRSLPLRSVRLPQQIEKKITVGTASAHMLPIIRKS